jgi:hypothetical protein
LQGASPYNKTEKDVSDFYHRLEAILSYLINEKGIVNLMPKDFAVRSQVSQCSNAG